MGESNERIPPLDWSSTAKSASMKQSRVPMCIRRIFTTVEEHFRENGKGCENRHLQSTQESSFYRSGTGEQRTHEQLVKQKKSYAMPLTTSIATFWNSGMILHTPYICIDYGDAACNAFIHQLISHVETKEEKKDQVYVGCPRHIYLLRWQEYN